MLIKYWIYLLFVLIISVSAEAPQVIGAQDFDPTKAKSACKAEDLAACLLYAEHLEQAGSTEQSLVFFAKVCEAGNEKICLKVAKLSTEPLKWLRKACYLPGASAEGCYRIAEIAKQNDSPNNYRHWLKKACAKKTRPACNILSVSGSK